MQTDHLVHARPTEDAEPGVVAKIDAGLERLTPWALLADRIPREGVGELFCASIVLRVGCVSTLHYDWFYTLKALISFVDICLTALIQGVKLTVVLAEKESSLRVFVGRFFVACHDPAVVK